MSKVSYYGEMLRKTQLLPAASKAWNYVKYRALPRRAIISVRSSGPQIASLWVTLRCNLKCGYCAGGEFINKEGSKWRESEATLEKVQRIFANPLFGNCLLVDLQGGEPLLVEDLDRIVAYLARRGHILNTSTNGMLLAERIADLKRAGISRINVSLYEANRAVIERDLEKINRVFPVHTSIVLLRSQVEKDPEGIVATARFLRGAGCRSLRFWIYRPVGTDPRPEEIIDETLPAYLAFRRRADTALPGFCLWPAAYQSGPVRKLCPQPWQRIGCDASGNLAICCGTDLMLKGPNSNLFDGLPDSVFNHPTLVALRENLLDPTAPPADICRSCNLLGEPGW